MNATDSNEKTDSFWFPIFVTEFLVISIINAFTITAFARTRHLRKRSTYLVMNLTGADLLVGVVTGTLLIYDKYLRKNEKDCTWPGSTVCAIRPTFPIASQVNLSLISLERLHATLFPFRHCLIKRCVYFKIIIASWFATFPLAFVLRILPRQAFPYALASFSAVTLLVLAVCYIIVIVNVQSNPHSQHHGSVQKEKKLSVTLLIVTGVSVLTILPMAIYRFIPRHIKETWNSTSSVDIHDILKVIYFANSIVNPLVYAIRMREFRKALRNLVSSKRQAAQTRERKAEEKRDFRLQPETNL